MSPKRTKMRANRKVIESSCGICGHGFELAEEVYACGLCGGIHHVACLDNNGSCPGTALVTSGPATDTAAETPPIAPPPLAEDERACPSCGVAIKTEALKCRHCGAVLNRELVSKIEPPVIPSYVADDVEKEAGKALMFSIASIFICGIILAPIAISKASATLKTLQEYPDYAATSSARTKARAGQIIGFAAVALWAVGIIARMSGS